jgi:hypothetical protein
METLIKSIVKALGVGADLDQIVEAARDKGYNEETIFLAVKAGQNLYDALQLQEEEK